MPIGCQWGLPEIAVLGCQKDPLFARALAITFRLVVFNNPLNSLANKTRTTSNENNRFRHDVREGKRERETEMR